MIISILTLFPEIIKVYVNTSILKRAGELRKVRFEIVNIRDFSDLSHNQVDDTPFGGGVGMILRIDVLESALKNEMGKFHSSHPMKRIILLDPRGKVYTQETAKRLTETYDHLILISAHYEGVDERIFNYVDEVVSVGDYILTGGEIPSLAIADSVTRLVPGVLKDEKATQDESFQKVGKIKTLSYPQYTRPQEYQGKKVPSVLLSGNHEKIKTWRRKMSLDLTKKFRPDLLNSKG